MRREAVAVGQLSVCLVPGDLSHADAVLLSRADAHGRKILDVNDGIGGDARFDQPAEQEVFIFPVGRLPPNPVGFPLVFACGGHEIGPGLRGGNKRPLHDVAAVDEALEFHEPLADKSLQSGDIADADHAEVLPPPQNVQHALFKIGRDHDLGVLIGDGFGRCLVYRAVEGDAPPEGGHPVGHVCPVVGLRQNVRLGDAAGVVVLDDHGGGSGVEVSQNVQGVVRIGQVGLSGVLPRLEEFDVRGQILSREDHLGFPQHQVTVDQPVERRFLAGVFTVPQSLAFAVDRPRDLVVEQRLTPGAIHKTDLHLRGKMIA